MPITFNRSICCDLHETISREWLITNGLGGYAAGTIAGVLTRLQHGLLVAAEPGLAVPHLLLAKIDEEVLFDERTYYLGTNEYQDGTLNPSGFVHLETFRLEEGFPIFTYRLGGIDGFTLEKRIWMPYGFNTTYIQYRVLPTGKRSRSQSRYTWQDGERVAARGPGSEASTPGQRSLELTLLPFSAYRPAHEAQYGHNNWHFQVEPLPAASEMRPPEAAQTTIIGSTIRAWENAQPYHLIASAGRGSHITFLPTGVWYWHFLRRHDQAAGRHAIDDLYLPGVFRAQIGLSEESALTLVATAEDPATLNLNPASLEREYQRNLARLRDLAQPQGYLYEGGSNETPYQVRALPIPGAQHPREAGEEFLRLMLQASDHFLVHRAPPQGTLAHSSHEPRLIPAVSAPFFEQQSWTRETLIALPGLTIASGRFNEARRLLKSFEPFLKKQGLLPDRLPQTGQELPAHDHRSADTTLWFFNALDHYQQTTGDYELVNELYPYLVGCVEAYLAGRLTGVQVAPEDGLLEILPTNRALTWMNAQVAGELITPRLGKPVEVNALWYNALSLLDEWSQQLHRRGRIAHPGSRFQELRTRVRESFQRGFWCEESCALYDVIDGPMGDDPSLRPNQLFAISLRHPVLASERWENVLTQVTRHLLTPFGLRTLAPQDPAYQGHPSQRLEDQQQALYQGSAWSWLLGPYLEALFKLQETTGDVSRSSEPLRSHEYLWRQGQKTLEPLRARLTQGLLGTFGSVFNGDAPHTAGYIVASPSEAGEILRVYQALAQLAQPPRHVLSGSSSL